MNRSVIVAVLVSVVGCTKDGSDTGDDWTVEQEGAPTSAGTDDGSGTDSGGGSVDGSGATSGGASGGGSGGGSGDGSGGTSGGSAGGTSGGDTGSGSGSGGEGAVGADHELIDPDCTDGLYTESLPTPEVDISADMEAYSSSTAYSFLVNVLDKRFETGRYILESGYASDGIFSTDCVSAFLGDTSSGTSVLRQASLLVHECGHFFDLDSGGITDPRYNFTDDLYFSCDRGSTPDNGGGLTFSRSRINNDAFADLHPPCASFTDSGCDSYAAIYLDGDPTDGTFDSGDQGFSMLHEETLQYIHSLATGYAVHDYISGSMSERDGILTFLWYTMRYLRMARLDYPETYALLSEDSCWRDLILTTWGRAWLYLDVTDGIGSLGINDTFLEALVREPVLIEEIDRLRAIEGCE